MEHISDPLQRILDEVRRKMDERERVKKKALAIKLCKGKRQFRPRKQHPGQFTLF